MKTEIRPQHNFTGAVLFATAILAAVHLLTYVWLTAFMYKDNIRGYVPAGITAITIAVIATCIVIVYLAIAERKISSPVNYIPVGCLGAILGACAASLYCRILMKLIGNSFTKDVGITAIGGIGFIMVALMLNKKFIGKRNRNGSSK